MQHLSRLDLGCLELELYGTAGSSSSSSTTTTTVPILPRLKELKLRECTLSHSTLLQLAQVSTLTHLELHPAAYREGVDLDHDAVKQLLQGLPNLAHLNLAHAGDEADLIPALSASSLTALSLGLPWSSNDYERPKLPDSTSELLHLRVFAVHRGEYNPASLASMTLLTQLDLQGCKPASTGLVSASAFLAAVRGMRHLQHLAVFDTFDDFEPDPVFLGVAQPCDCTALTASSQLTYLQIRREHGQPLPAAAPQRMFPAGKQLPRLQHLVISSGNEDADDISTAELRSLVGACPALHILSLRGVLVADVEVDLLLQLPSTCRSLSIGGLAFGDRAVRVIAQLTQLTSLYWWGSSGLTAAGLLPLTELRALETFWLPCMRSSGINFLGVVSYK